ncbi:TetR/AcrR family transcriptional regulator [Streptomyces sp. NPDC058953]|uniref:TetR/AcrR family transcriptional regulator n=1 Tax=unclassified Streptomyces TaxID=2593676 RepID=UPI0036A531C5
MVRMSAEERRESVIRAAASEFATGGYNGTSTETIARRVGVSQPYLFRLFTNKRELFLAVARRCMADMGRVFADALEESPDGDPEVVMAEAYRRLIDGDRELLLLQMQIYVAVSTAEASGDAEFGDAVRRGWLDIAELVSGALGGGTEAGRFLGYGMLINALVSLGFPADHRVWREYFAVPPGSGGE